MIFYGGNNILGEDEGIILKMRKYLGKIGMGGGREGGRDPFLPLFRNPRPGGRELRGILVIHMVCLSS